MKARKEYGMPGNTLRDFTRICELDIIDKEKYKTRIQQVTGNKARQRGCSVILGDGNNSMFIYTPI